RLGFLLAALHDQLRDAETRERLARRIDVIFSSGRRHTRSYGDWSSDVCSSDLNVQLLDAEQPLLLRRHRLTSPRHDVRNEQHVRSEERRVGKEWSVCARWRRQMLKGSAS